MNRYFQIPHAVIGSDIYRNPEWFRAYCDIMSRVWREESRDKQTQKGEVIVTLRKSAMRWGWDKNKVSRFLAYLVENKWLKCTDKTSTFTVRDTKSDTIWDENRDTKKPKKQRVSKKDRDTFGDTKRDTKQDTTPIIGKTNIGKTNKEESAGSGLAAAAPPAQLLDADGLPVYGVTPTQWEQFQKWAKANIPSLMEVGITPVDFRSMRNGSLNNREKFTKILLAMEKAGKPHKVCVEFYNKLERWDIDKFNGVYG